MKKKMNGFRGLFILFVTLAILSFLSLFLVSCEKDTTEPSLFVKAWASPDTLKLGESSQLSWYSNANSVLIGQMTLGKSGSIIVSPRKDSTFTISILSGNEEMSVAKVKICVTTPQVPPKISLSVDPPVVQYGMTSTIYIFTENVNCINSNLPGVGSCLNGRFQTPPLGEDATYFFDFTTLDGITTIRDSVSIKVNPPTENEVGMSSDPWVVFKSEKYDSIGEKWEDRGINFSDPCMSDDRLTFVLLPRSYILDPKTLCSGGIGVPATGSWNVEGDILNAFFPIRTIEHIDKELMILSYEGTEYNATTGVSKTTSIRDFYKHP